MTNRMIWLTGLLALLCCCCQLTNGYGAKSGALNTDFGGENYEDLYAKGRRAYLDNNFKECVTLIEAALSEYKSYNTVVNECKLACKQHQDKEETSSVVEFLQEYRHYEGLIQETLCLMKCKRGKINPNRREEIFNPVLVQDFATRKTYDYLQLCYFQTQQLQEAANAAFTNSVYNPEHGIMKDNLKYYLDLPGVEKQLLVNMETAEFVHVYREARTLYTAGNWVRSAEKMEQALQLYLQEETLCRVGCEKPFNMGWYPDFVSSVANHFTFCLKCKLNCATDLHTIDGVMEEDLLPQFYHYLQFSYFKASDLRRAADCAVTYLAFRPGVVDMQNNLNYYREYSEFKGEIRPEAKHYLERETDELNLLEFIEKSFVFTEDQNIEEEKLAQKKDTERENKESEDKDRSKNEAGTEIEEEHEDNNTEDVTNKSALKKQKQGTQEAGNDLMWAQWSSEEGKYVIEDKNRFEDGPAFLSPPPLVKFEL